ncbi:MAG: DUF4857 domain-containing protein [Desulfobacula sp.]|nr:DUF4857 domain-containing protein [Desulfobacula sp.]
MKKCACLCFTLLVILVSAIYLPILYEKVFFKQIKKTHLFYSPVSRDFILKEKFTGPVPEQALKNSVDHHTGIAYQKADNTYVSRRQFEKHLPFIFYKNMEIWGLLPLELGGRKFDKQTIKKNRRVMELKSIDIIDRRPFTPFWPLLESNPGQARLVFPDDRFRMTPTAMEFINADTNRKDKALTKTFTNALKDCGFIFPVQSINGKFTVLKPFDEGIFMVDAKFSVFHVKRINGKPEIIKTPIDTRLKTRFIKISENRQKQYYGLLLTHTGQLNLLSYDNYKLIPLPLIHYDPDCMDIKLIFNPLFCTAVYSDQTMIRALAMDRDFTIIKKFSHTMSRARVTLAKQVYHTLFPFCIYFDTENSGFLSMQVQSEGKYALLGLIVCLGIFFSKTMLGRKKPPGLWKTALVATTGIYGFIAINIIDIDDEP